jgi:hypothetical protein
MGALGIKKPPTGHITPEGASAPAPPGHQPHTARLQAGRRLHRSTPLQRAAATRTVLPRSLRFHVPYVCIYVTQPLGCQEQLGIFIMI